MLRTGICIAMLLFGHGVDINHVQIDVIKPIQRFTYSEGGVLNATFSLPDQIVVQSQKMVYPADLKNERSIAFRYLAIYGIKKSAWLYSVPTNSEGEVSGSGFISGGCSRIVYVKTTNSLIVCEGDHTIRIRDAATLEIKKVIPLNASVRSADLAVAEHQNAIYVVGVGQNGGIVMSRYSLATGVLINTTEVSRSSRYAEVALTIADGDQMLAITMHDIRIKGEMPGAIITCRTAEQPLTCNTIPQKQGVAEAAFLSNESLLFVSTGFATSHSSDCIQDLQLTTLQSNPKAFCSKDGGVHYSTAVLGRNKVIAFTGYAKDNWFTENISTVNNSASVWDIESRRIVAVTRDNADYGAGQNLVQIVADDQGNSRFLVFWRFANAISLYELPPTP